MTKILIADDNLTTWTQTVIFFEERGFTVLATATLEGAVKMARAETPDVAVLDSDARSKIDGLAAVKAIKQSLPRLKVILLLDDVHHHRQGEARMTGADVVLNKDLTTLTALAVAVINLAGEAQARP